MRTIARRTVPQTVLTSAADVDGDDFSTTAPQTDCPAWILGVAAQSVANSYPSARWDKTFFMIRLLLSVVADVRSSARKAFRWIPRMAESCNRKLTGYQPSSEAVGGAFNRAKKVLLKVHTDIRTPLAGV